MNRNLFLGLLAAFAAAATGSAWQLASRHGVTTTLGPRELAALRYFIPAVVLAPVLWRMRGFFPAGLSRRRLALLVAGGGVPFGLVVLAGAQFAPAAHMGIFVAGCVPLFATLGSWWLDREPIGGMRLAGLALVVIGIAAFGADSWRASPGAWRGDAMFLVAAVLWGAIYTLASRGSGLGPWQGAALVNGWSALLLLPLLAIAGAPRLWTAPLADLAWQAIGQGVVAGLLGLVAYLAAIVRLGAARASLSAALVPLLTAAGGAWLLDEPLSRATVVAAVVVALGVLLAATGAVDRDKNAR